jgi:3-deoxy-D-manno-octulosonate 8-phosphate phosphatase (KDO 8-P phosphatase)
MQNYSNIKLVVLDVDGTLTDGGVYYDSHGHELKRFDVKDGLGIRIGIAAGLEFAIITGRESVMVERRTKELGIQHLYQGVQKKAPAMKALISSLGLSKAQVAYMGDDLNDKAPMRLAGLCACPADADPDILELSDYIAPHPGGAGAVRDFIHEILEQQGVWNTLIEETY